MAKSRRFREERPPRPGRRFSVQASGLRQRSSNGLPPLFSLEHLPSYSRYSLSGCTKDEKAAFADTLAKLSKMTWGDINQAPRSGSGYEKILRNAIKAGTSHVKEDVEFFLAFRCLGKAPMVGYRVDRVFYVVWIDREFTLYSHSP